MEVIKIDKETADRFVSEKHYTRSPSIFWAGFALVENGMIEGVVVYGQPSPPIQKHAFRDRDFRLYELSRLVVQSKTKNASSFLVANSLKMLPSPCAVVSYADSEMGHAGIIYQATNWLYTGSTVSHDHVYIVDGKRTHPMTLRERGITDPKKWARDNGVETAKPHPKHRYFFVTGKRSDRKSMLSRLSYPILSEYPKSPRVRYDDGPLLSVRATVQGSLF